MPTPPLDDRSNATVAWTGEEVLVFGGSTGPACPPNADCVLPEEWARDGAAYSPAKGTWRRIADAPLGIVPHPGSAVVDGRLYVLTQTKPWGSPPVLLAYDVARDAWSRVSLPRGFTGGQLVASAKHLLVVSGSDENGVHPDRIFTPETDRWTTLPDDPIGKAFDRMVTATPQALVLTAKKLVPSPGGEDGPSFVLAARFDLATQQWTRLPDSDQIGGWRWTWTGTRLVDTTLGGADGGQVNNYGRMIPNGGRLDPRTGEWSRLPKPPRERSGGWPVEALGGPLVAAEGWVYDDAATAWNRLTRPTDGPEEPGSAVWAGDRLFVYGGDTWREMKGDRSGEAWLSAPMAS